MLKRIGAFLVDILEVIVFATSIFLFMYLLVMQPHKIKGDSMKPNFLHGQFLLTDKVTYRIRAPKRGEIIVFKAPLTEGDEYIKRIIGLPGEQIAIREGKVFINGEILNEAYIPYHVATLPGTYLKEGSELIIPGDHYAVFGDNRLSSLDSRAWGFISKDKITGRAWVIYWPPPAFGLVEQVEYSF